MLLRLTARTIVFAALMGVLLFVPAGTLAWPQGWAFLVLFNGSGLIIGVWLAKADPGLLAARMKSPLSRDQRRFDRVVMFAIMGVFYGWFIFMGIDARRMGWSHTPVWAQVLGAVLIIVTVIGSVGVLKANSFAAVTINVQSERGQTVATTGPYAVVRHPMYGYLLLMMLGTPLLLGSLWGLLGIVVMLPLLVARAAGEEAILRDGLPGYREYMEKVRHRFIPGLW